ncbi:hypothetical protein RUND412_010340 [Rhizina undulata]
MPYVALLTATAALTKSFADHAPPSEIVKHFTTTPAPIALEHGLRRLAPFIGREFLGTDQVRVYFEMLAEYLEYTDMEFSPPIIDTAGSKVCVKGTAIFTWKETGESWREAFVWLLDWEDIGEEKQEWKVKRYEVWADSGAVYLARKGKLGVVEAGGEYGVYI